MMKRLTRIKLDFEKTKPYFLNHISSDTSLSKLVAEKINKEEGFFFIDLPENCHFTRLYELRSGGMTPTIDVGAEPEKNALNQSYIPRRFMSTDKETSHFINRYLKQNDKNIAIFNDIDLRASDKNIAIQNVSHAFDEQEVYFILNGMNSERDVYKTFRAETSAWHTLIILTSGQWTDSGRFIHDNGDDFLRNLRYIIAGAYDGEAYVVWQVT